MVLIFDFDSTLVQDEGLDELFLHSLDGRADRDERMEAFREITDRGMDGALAYGESLRLRMEVLEANRTHVAVTGERLASRLSPSVERHRSFFSSSGHEVHIVSGGFEELIEPAARRLGIPVDRIHAQRFLFDAKGEIRGIDPSTPLARGGKVGAVQALGLDPVRVWIVGDGATDMELRDRGVAGTFVAFTENRTREPVVRGADRVVTSMDELLQLLDGAG